MSVSSDTAGVPRVDDLGTLLGVTTGSLWLVILRAADREPRVGSHRQRGHAMPRGAGELTLTRSSARVRANRMAFPSKAGPTRRSHK